MLYKNAIITLLTIATVGSTYTCRNTITNNTALTFKVAEIKQHNADLKQALVLPDDYVKDEEKASTLKPGEETDFGGHYLPKFVIYKEYPDKKWRPLLYVKQVRCAPDGADPSRFPENKYLLMTDLLKQQLPGDYQQVYSFILKAEPSELTVESVNTKQLTKIANPYQEMYNIIDDMTQKMQELWSIALKQQETPSPAPIQSDKESQQGEEVDKNDGQTCTMCAKPAA